MEKGEVRKREKEESALKNFFNTELLIFLSIKLLKIARLFLTFPRIIRVNIQYM
jgi:hypothetical protein